MREAAAIIASHYTHLCTPAKAAAASIVCAAHSPTTVPRPVVPQPNLGNNSFRNLVSCCLDCNSLKVERHAVEFVRSLYRDRRLSAHEMTARLRALDDLAAGKLKPALPRSGRLRKRGTQRGSRK
jgi:hypothetical protein